MAEAGKPVYEALTLVRMFGGAQAVEAAELVMNRTLDYGHHVSRSEWWDLLHDVIAQYRGEMPRPGSVLTGSGLSMPSGFPGAANE